MTYSGGHANQGQGGFYGSGGARVSTATPTHHPEAIANQRDVMELSKIMVDVENLENELRSLGTVVNSRTIEIKARLKKTISNPRVREILNRLEIKGQVIVVLDACLSIHSFCVMLLSACVGIVFERTRFGSCSQAKVHGELISKFEISNKMKRKAWINRVCIAVYSFCAHVFKTKKTFLDHLPQTNQR